MAIGPCTPEDIRSSMEHFDRKLRDTEDWRGWEEKQNHKYAFNENGKLYPMKEIISRATGTPRKDFNGGTESIKFARDLGFSAVALRLPSVAETKAAIHDLLLQSYPEPVTPQEAYEELAHWFKLSPALRDRKMETGNDVHWENRVRQARRQLVAEGVIDNSEKGAWRLRSRGYPKVWVEKSLVSSRPDRQDGAYALGQLLWSPMRSANEGDIYRLMRSIEPGDIVLHLIDNSSISGVSIANDVARPRQVGVPGTPWGNRECYTVALRDYTTLHPALSRDEFLENENYQRDLKRVLKENSYLFYNSKLELNQGAYLTEAPRKLLEILNEAYMDHSEKSIPYISGFLSTPNAGLQYHRLNAAITLFYWIYGSDGLAGEIFVNEEREYKESLSSEWRKLVTEDFISKALRSSGKVGPVGEIAKFFTKTNLVPWRYSDAIRKISTEEDAGVFLHALRDLLFSDQGGPDIDAFNAALLPIYKKHLNEGAVKSASHCIPSFALWMHDPSEHFFVRTNLINQSTNALAGGSLNESKDLMTTAYYSDVLRFVDQLRDGLAALNPRDLIDVQGFLWGIFSRPRIWFGGKSYHGRQDMLPEFLKRQVFAVGFADQPEVREILQQVPATSNASERDDLRSRLTALLPKKGERDAIEAFFDLLSSPGSVLIAKSAWYDKGLKQSLVRYFATCSTGSHYSYDEALGHQVSVDWRTQEEHTVLAGEYYPKLNATLQSLPLIEALDAINLDPPETPVQTPPQVDEGPEEEEEEETSEIPENHSEIEANEARQNEPQPRYTAANFAEETGFSEDTIGSWRRRLERKRHVVFQGPPGTGKTFVAEKLARLLVSETLGTWDVVQFHPTYAYEDFMQGIRPKVISGGITYQVEPGRFLDFCWDAEKRPEGHPCVLIVDEINRANLSRVFGELMYLLEYRDKAIPLALGGKFKIPDNVYLVGTMNTADRSIALVDHALRRRFSFIHLGPDYDILGRRLENDSLPSESLVNVLRAINDRIDDRNYEVGISFFMKDGPDLRHALPDIWLSEIEPYLEEYFYDRPEEVEAFRWEALLASELADWKT